MIESNNFYDAWMILLDEVLHHGSRVSPRGLPCRELLHTQLTVTDLRNNVLVHTKRDLNYRFMVAEWLFIQAGREDVATLDRYNKQIKRFSDDGMIFNGAYGPRLASQWPYVINNIKNDKDSRQAVLVIFGERDQKSVTKDVACTICLQVLLREGKLHGIVTMRSNDLWLGLPYDFYNFSQIVNYLAGVLEVEPGSLTVQAGSSHLYETNWVQAEDTLWHPGEYVRSPRVNGFFSAADALDEASGDFSDWSSLHMHYQTQQYADILKMTTKAAALEGLRKLGKGV